VRSQWTLRKKKYNSSRNFNAIFSVIHLVHASLVKLC